MSPSPQTHSVICICPSHLKLHDITMYPILSAFQYDRSCLYSISTYIELHYNT